MVQRLDDDADAVRLEHLVDGVGDLRGQLLLDLQAPGVDLDHAGELADADHAAAWHVGDFGVADDRRHVMLAMALEANIAQHHHLVVARDLREGFLQDRGRVLCVAGEVFLERTGDPRRRFPKTFAIGIVAGPADQGPHRGLGLGALRPPPFGVKRRDPLQRPHIRSHADYSPALRPKRPRRRVR